MPWEQVAEGSWEEGRLELARKGDEVGGRKRTIKQGRTHISLNNEIMRENRPQNTETAATVQGTWGGYYPLLTRKKPEAQAQRPKLEPEPRPIYAEAHFFRHSTGEQPPGGGPEGREAAEVPAVWRKGL